MTWERCHTSSKWRDSSVPQWRDRLDRDDVRSLDSVVTRQKHLHYLVVVVLRGEYQWSDVRRKLALLFRSEERIVLTSSTFDPLLARHVVRMFYDDFNDLRRTLCAYTAVHAHESFPAYEILLWSLVFWLCLSVCNITVKLLQRSLCRFQSKSTVVDHYRTGKNSH